MYQQSGKKPVKQQYLLHVLSQYGELRPISGWDRFTSFGHPSKFQWVLHVGFVTALASVTGGQPNFAWYLAISWAVSLYVHIRGLLLPKGILPRAKFTLHPSRVILYWQRYCAALEHDEQWASAKLCGMASSRDRAAIPFDIGRLNCLVFICFSCH